MPFPSPGNLPNPEVEPRSPALQEDSLPAEPQGKPSGSRGGLRPTEQEEREKVGKWAAGECAHSGWIEGAVSDAFYCCRGQALTQRETGRQREEDSSKVTSGEITQEKTQRRWQPFSEPPFLWTSPNSSFSEDLVGSLCCHTIWIFLIK